MLITYPKLHFQRAKTPQAEAALTGKALSELLERNRADERDHPNCRNCRKSRHSEMAESRTESGSRIYVADAVNLCSAAGLR
jgi:hypothetical protein